ncbi:MAG: acyl-CoA dehydrogenase family protein [Actinomycetota bacterium]
MTDAVGTARELASAFAARAAAYDRDGCFPEADFADIRAAGLLGLLVPQELGGMGATFGSYLPVARELARGSGATALIFNMHASVTGALAGVPEDVARALGAGDAFFEHRDRVLGRAAEGAFFGVAMSERGAGSRLTKMTTAYQREGDGWRIRGAKSFCSGAGHADSYLVAARNGEKVSQFLVPAGDGVVVEPTWDSLGMRATASHDIHFDTLAPLDALIGGVEGMAVMLAQYMPQWLVASYAAVYAGVAQSAIDAAVTYLTRRDGVGRLPAVRARLGRADAKVAATWLAVEQAGRYVDEQPATPEANRWVYRAKLLAGETAMEVAASMLEACGTAATRRGEALERIYRDARCGSLQPATSDVCADWLGLDAQGLDPDDAEVSRW